MGDKRSYILPYPISASSNPNLSPQQRDQANCKMSSTKSGLIPEDYIWRKDYIDHMRKRAEQLDGTYNTTPSQAWFQVQEENARRHTSSSAVPTIGGDDDFKPIPIVKNVPSIVKAPPTAGKPLKSAMKKATLAKKE